jgi:aminopeptidase N
MRKMRGFLPRNISKMDPSSFSNEDHTIKHCDLEWSIDFDAKKITGTCLYSIKVNNLESKHLVLDSKALDVMSISIDGQPLEFTLSTTSKIPGFGEKLTIALPADLGQEEIKILIKYSTSKACSALQWLTPDQTVGKVHPYLFSQCQAIHARSILPCQDTPAVKITYSAKVTVPKGLRALMSAVPTGNEENVFTFNQSIAIPSYLIAIAVGDIVGIRVGPRSTVWSEPATVKQAAWEFEDTENFIKGILLN